MILPGLVSIAFYRRKPSTLQIAAGLAFTIAISGLLGYIQDYGTSRVWENTIVAIIGGVILYIAVLAILYYWYFPKHDREMSKATTPPTSPPS